MKKTKTYMVIAVVIAVLILGIGYAAMEGINLTINGSASATTKNENFKVRFDNTVTPSSNAPEGATATGTITNEKVATIAVSGLTTKGQVATVTYTIENYSDELSAQLANPTITNSNTDYFEVTSTLAKATIAKGEKTTLTVTVTLKKTPVADQTTDIELTLAATPKAV